MHGRLRAWPGIFRFGVHIPFQFVGPPPGRQLRLTCVRMDGCRDRMSGPPSCRQEMQRRTDRSCPGEPASRGSHPCTGTSFAQRGIAFWSPHLEKAAASSHALAAPAPSSGRPHAFFTLNALVGTVYLRVNRKGEKRTPPRSPSPMRSQEHCRGQSDRRQRQANGSGVYTGRSASYARFHRYRSRALPMTQTSDSPMAAAAIQGCSRPTAARGIATTL